MSAEEKRIPEGLENALSDLAKKTVQNGWDPVKVVSSLMRGLEWWASLTPEQREAVRVELRRTRVPRVAENRKPRSARKPS